MDTIKGGNIIIDEFCDELQKNEDVLGVLLFGSWARGNNRADSDVDLLVIKSSGFSRTVEIFKDVPFEITYTTEPSVKEYWSKNPDDCVELWNIGRILFEKNDVLSRLKSFAEEVKSNGKKAISNDEIKHIQFDVYDQIKAVKKLALTDSGTATMLLQSKVFYIVEKYFDLRRLWTPPTKQRLDTLKEINPIMYALLEQFYSLQGTIEDKTILAKQIADLVFKI